MPGLKYSRVLLKLSGEALSGEDCHGLAPSCLGPLTDDICKIQSQGVQLGMVIGGGNIVRGSYAVEHGIDRVSADYMGMLATVINALAVQNILESRGLETRVMTAIRMEQLAEPYIRRRAIRHLEKGRVVIFAGGTGNPYFSTDTAAVLRAIETESQIILKATKVDGIYTADPEINKKARFIRRLSYLEVLKKEIRVMDTTAITLCMDNKLPIQVFNMGKKGALPRIVAGEIIGTVVEAKS
ncbi:MAG: UMP kinase [Candidatus Glassbacteria bacterium RIFCSPLOWO2_12_FULL_58_11]|uniref:Uridylate kinase n=2 Tax=Candidatus Glassiibacteriota TaxID=1817805 RepID=A0A1F5YWD5_9BACT|nr:MAG: UMP kinase [Candidatus Glassbacteria bacterium GWA2_58_10]OGG04435.1 MAG: UMP kinase [Candidatus Glassbacteria bacterium RIFCSPLOWO2_12_FULL_58_11]